MSDELRRARAAAREARTWLALAEAIETAWRSSPYREPTPMAALDIERIRKRGIE